jgi:hypothetical protein
MRRIAIPTVAVLALFLVGAAPSGARASHKTPAKCNPAGSRILLANAHAQIYEAGAVIRGCVFGQERFYLLGEAEQCGGGGGGGGCVGVQLETLTGTMVAYEEGLSSENETSNVVVVLDLRNGRFLHKAPTGAPAKPSPERVGTGSATAIVVKSDGAVAWIAENEELSVKESTYYEVHAVDKTVSRVLAAGKDIEPDSLALAGSTLYWTQGGKPMSSTLN